MKRCTIILALIAVGMIACNRASVQNEATLKHVIEDFEGVELWDGLVCSTALPRSGNASGEWTSLVQQSTVGPQQLIQDWSPFDELSFYLYSETPNNQGVTLVLYSDNPLTPGTDYYYYHFYTNWRGWKRFSLDFRHDMRAARSPLGWDAIEGMSFSAAGWGHAPLESSILRFDLVQLIHYPASIRLIDQYKERREQGIAVISKVEIENRLGWPQEFEIYIDDGQLELFSAELQSEVPQTLMPGETRQTTAVLFITDSKLEEVQLLAYEDIAVRVRTEGSDSPEGSLVLRAVTPLPERQHPFLFLSREEISRAKARAEKYEWAEHALEAIISRAKRALEESYSIPDIGGQWTHHYVCDECGVMLETISPTEHQCPQCAVVYSGWPYDQVVIAHKHRHNGTLMLDLAIGYAFTGDEKYAEKAVEIMLGYANKYLTYELHDRNGGEGISAGRMFAQTLDEAVAVIDVAWAYDLVYDTISAQEREKIENEYLTPVAETVMRYDAGISNWQTWHNAAIGVIGFCLQDEALAASAIYGGSGLFSQLGTSVLPSGWWYEGTPAYHFYALNAIRWLSEAAYHSGLNIYVDPRLKLLFTAPLSYVFPDLSFPMIGDSYHFSLCDDWSGLYEIAYSRLGDSDYAIVARQGRQAGGMEALFWGVDTLPENQQEHLALLESMDLPGIGTAILRQGVGETQMTLLMDYGSPSTWHSHPAKLGMVLYGLGQELSPDPGRLEYGSPLHEEWYIQTIAHNTVVVDEKTQALTGGSLDIFEVSDQVKVMRGKCDTAYPGVVLERTLVLTPHYVLDLFLVLGESDHTYDWVYHNFGCLATNMHTQQLGQPLAKDAGYQHVSELHQAETEGTWSTIWELEKGGVKVTMAGNPGTNVFFGEGFYGRDAKRLPMVVVRRYGKRTLYASVIEVFTDKPEVENVSVIPVTVNGEKLAGDRAIAVEVRRGETTDLFMIADGDVRGMKQFGSVRTEAWMAFIPGENGLGEAVFWMK